MKLEIVQVIAVSVALIACITDLRTQRIPNALTFGGAIAALAYYAITAGASGLFLSTLGWAAGVLLFIVPFALGGMGAGDVKLLAALGAWLGPADALWIALYSGIAGGVLALFVGLGRGYLREAFANISRLLMHWRVVGMRPLHDVSLAGSKGPRLAYAVPMFAGLVATIWLR